jgi:hypothetical protein
LGCGASGSCGRSAAMAERRQQAAPCRQPNGCATCSARIGAPVAVPPAASPYAPITANTNKPQNAAAANTAGANKPQNSAAPIYPASTVMPATGPAVVPAAVLSPYSSLSGGYRVEPNRNVLPGRSDQQPGGQQ